MIGIFDSGIGGLTVLSRIHQRLPGASLVYLADHAFAPYGNRAQAEVAERCHQVAQWLVAQGCRLLVVACNTATAMAVDALRQRLAVPIVGVEPGVKPAALNSRARRIGILATDNTLTSGRYQALLARFLPSVDIVSQGCPGLADVIEARADSSQLLRRYTEPLLARGVDHIVLGCTHYPLVQAPLQALVGEGVQIVDTGAAIAQEVARRHGALARVPGAGAVRLFTTGQVAELRAAIAHYPPLHSLAGSLLADTQI